MFLPTQHAGRQRRWLLDLTWGGAEYHLAEEEAEVTVGGETVRYLAGLVVAGGVERGAQVGDGVLDAPAVSLELHLEGVVDVPARIAAGYPLSAATGTLWLWLEGTEHRERIVSGYIDGPEFGEADEPVVVTLEDDRLTNDLLFPPANARMVAGSQNPGERYPWIIGAPGSSDAFGSSALVWATSGSPTALVDEVLVAGHPVDASSVTIYNADEDFDDSLSVTTDTDSFGRTVSIVDISSWTAVRRVPTARFYARWTGTGLLIRNEAVSGAGDVLRWALTQTQLTVAPGRLAALLPRLNQYTIACDITAAPDRRIDMWDWIEANLLPVLPLSAVRTPDGLDFVLWRWDATSSDAVAHLVEGENAVRLGGVGTTSRGAVRNELRLAYAPDVATSSYTRTAILTGDPDTLRIENDSVAHRDCVRSRQLFGKTLTWEGSTDVVYSDTTAFRILRDKARELALPSEHVGYSVGPLVGAHLAAGDVVVVTDAGIGWDEVLCFVENKPAEAGEEFGLAVRPIRAR